MRYCRFTSLALLLLLLTGCSTFAPWRDQSFVEQHVTFIAIHICFFKIFFGAFLIRFLL